MTKEMTLAEFRENTRQEVEFLVSKLDPTDDLFPMLLIPRYDVTDSSTGKSTLVMVHLGEFFNSGQRGKDIFVNLALPVLIHKMSAKTLAFVASAWTAAIGPEEEPDEEKRDLLIKLFDTGGIEAIPAKFKRECVMVRTCDGKTELSAFAMLTRHEGAAPTIAWDKEKEDMFDNQSEGSGRMSGGFLIKAFERARTVPPVAIEFVERLLGMGYWQPNPDDTPDLFKPESGDES